MQEHRPVRRWRSARLRNECSCGRWTACPPPQWIPGTPIPDGDTVPWPTNDRWTSEPTRELTTRPFLTLGQQYRSRGWYRA
jgi:hypothetical protein